MKWLRMLALVVGIIAVVVLIVAGPGTRFGVWSFRLGLSLLRYAAYLGIAAVVLAIIALIATMASPPVGARGGPIGVLVIALVLGAIAFLVPWGFVQKAKGKPPIHDITTDTRNPPEFVAVLPLRRNAVNPSKYEGDSVAALQQKGYPDIRPLELSVPPGQAYSKALAVAHDMGWAIDAADSSAGRLEATATTAWFGFKDDIVVRVRPDSAGSRVDVRSVSRVGKGDFGTNAARVREYLSRMAQNGRS